MRELNGVRGTADAEVLTLATGYGSPCQRPDTLSLEAESTLGREQPSYIIACVRAAVWGNGDGNEIAPTERCEGAIRAC